MQETLAEIYEAVDQVIRRGGYLNIVLSAEFKHRAEVHFVVKGTVEHYFELKSSIEALAPKKVKPALVSLLLPALFMLKYSDIPRFAVTSGAVEFAGKRFGAGVKGFVNAVLKNVDKIPPLTGKKELEARLNAPYFLVEALEKDGFDAEKILRPEKSRLVHFRLGKKGSPKDLEGLGALESSEAGGWFSEPDKKLSALNSEGKISFISPSSMECVNAFGNIAGKSFLDVAAAPGGKSVYASDKGAAVTAGDIHPHRVELIKSYARRTGAKINALTNDATIFRSDWEGTFDCVLVDAPCMGLGVVGARPDVTLNRSPSDIETISRLQKGILSVSSRYVKPGGKLVYSTCSLLKAESSAIISDFVQNNDEFRILNYKNNCEFGRYIMPDDRWDGFFVSVTERR